MSITFSSVQAFFTNEYERSYKCKKESFWLTANGTNNATDNTSISNKMKLELGAWQVQAFEFREEHNFGNGMHIISLFLSLPLPPSLPPSLPLSLPLSPFPSLPLSLPPSYSQMWMEVSSIIQGYCRGFCLKDTNVIAHPFAVGYLICSCCAKCIYVRHQNRCRSIETETVDECSLRRKLCLLFSVHPQLASVQISQKRTRPCPWPWPVCWPSS